MSDASPDWRRTARWALPASLALHGLVIALLIFGLPISPLLPEKEQAVSVDLVSPPKQPEIRVPPPPQPAKPQAPPETKAKTPTDTPEGAPRRKPIPVLNPVHQFGEKNAGPRKSPKGDNAQNAASSLSAASRQDKQGASTPNMLTASGQTGKTSPPPSSQAPASATENAGKGQADKELHEAKTLFSGSDTGDPVATTAMRGLPRDMRAGWLCVTELRDQLEHASPPAFPEVLPSYRLREGTLMDIRQAAFRVGGQWYDLSFRCQIDPAATKVIYFALRVGEAIPPAEWASRGLPSE